ncbi:hypothetical protein Pcinc_036209 [Petrolisthes cinctipes]|uniref:Uncharacterized protein n=1 Tax=Petrolisthes cinctipes TaxID=88211 RepID=A0AAE1BW52_PETCI|nr:hypothetical protein Pcinc_036209 [Petrolisthes cinctipes]
MLRLMVESSTSDESTNQNYPLMSPSTATSTTTLTTTTTTITTPASSISQSSSGTELERRPSQDSIASSDSQEAEAWFTPPPFGPSDR